MDDKLMIDNLDDSEMVIRSTPLEEGVQSLMVLFDTNKDAPLFHLFIEDEKVKFVGNYDKSAKMFFDFLSEDINKYIAKLVKHSSKKTSPSERVKVGGTYYSTAMIDDDWGDADRKVVVRKETDDYDDYDNENYKKGNYYRRKVDAQRVASSSNFMIKGLKTLNYGENHIFKFGD